MRTESVRVTPQTCAIFALALGFARTRWVVNAHLSTELGCELQGMSSFLRCGFMRTSAVLIFLASTVQLSARPLNDTGVTDCSDGTQVVPCSTVRTTHPGQDARYGRDVAASASIFQSAGGNSIRIKGFDFTKLSQTDGAELPPSSLPANTGPSPSLYGCVRDNATNLVWSISYNAPVHWGDPNPNTNGGNPGIGAMGHVSHLNSLGYCGRTNWRLPSVRELLSVITFSVGSGCPATYIDQIFTWPNTVFWTNQTSVTDSSQALVVWIGAPYTNPNGSCTGILTGKPKMTAEPAVVLVSGS